MTEAEQPVPSVWQRPFQAPKWLLRLQNRKPGAFVRAAFYEALANSERCGLPVTVALAALSHEPERRRFWTPRDAPRVLSGVAAWLFALVVAPPLALIGALLAKQGVGGEHGVQGLRVRRLARMVLERIEQGMSLGDAMAAEPGFFPPFEIALVRAGERSGRLAATLRSLAQATNLRQALILRFYGALHYQGMAVLYAVTLGGGILAFVYPKFSAILRETDIRPAPGAWLVGGLSDLLSQRWDFVVGGILGAILLSLLLFRRPVRAALVRLPGPAGLLRRAGQGRFLLVLGHLLEARVPAPEAISMAAAAVGTPQMRAAGDRAGAQVARGTGLLDALESERCVSQRAAAQLRVVAQREDFGQRCTLLAGDLLEDLDRLVIRLTAMTEPFAVVVLAAVVGSLVIFLYVTEFHIATLMTNQPY